MHKYYYSLIDHVKILYRFENPILFINLIEPGILLFNLDLQITLQTKTIGHNYTTFFFRFISYSNLI